MVHIHLQKFYERFTGIEHEVSITFGNISPISRGYYTVRVDGEHYSDHDSKAQAYDEVVDILKQTNWSPLRPI